MKQLAILCVLSNFFLNSFGQTNNNKGLANTVNKNGANANQKNYSKLKLIDQFNNILQKDTATAVWETAGRKTTNNLGRSLGFVGDDTTRILKPAIEKDIANIEKAIERVVKDAMRTVQREL